MKNLSLILGLMIAASPAFASRARLEALGEGKNGSYYINDSRNIFLNPAQIVKHKKKLWLELGGEPGNTTRDLAEAPRGQGGFSNTFGDYTYGVYLNQTSERAINIASQANALGGAFIAADSQAELTFAGEGGMNWGISLFYAGNNTKSAVPLEKTASLFGTRLGIESGSLAVYSTIGIMSSSKVLNATADEIKGKMSVDLAATYGMDNWTWFGKFATFGSDVALTSVTTEVRTSSFGGGFGYTKEWSKTATMFTRLEADYAKQTVTGLSDTVWWNVPLVIGAEAQALSWLAVRGSIAQSLIGQTYSEPTRNNYPGTTTVAAGLGATFGDVNIDGLISLGTTTTTDIPGFGTAPTTAGNFGFGNNMLSRVALTYNF